MVKSSCIVLKYCSSYLTLRNVSVGGIWIWKKIFFKCDYIYWGNQYFQILNCPTYSTNGYVGRCAIFSMTMKVLHWFRCYLKAYCQIIANIRLAYRISKTVLSPDRVERVQFKTSRVKCVFKPFEVKFDLLIFSSSIILFSVFLWVTLD